MSNYGVCGLDCDICKFKTEKKCLGCKTIKGKVFWGECELYRCNSQKNLVAGYPPDTYCSKCKDFPCIKLKQWAAEEGTERIDNLRKL